MDKNRTMKVLAIRSDKPEAELYIYEGKDRLAEVKWQAHRQLTETIHNRINEILDSSSISLKEVQGIICFKGPGSFTGLRIGLSVANALAYAQEVPIVARGGKDWLEQGINDLLGGKNDKIVTPQYGAPAKTTSPKK
ncbi:tRNA (adenosine(37)-N6)-threonylcarbamoyltransferase complex dimerization subunit type 1 TsaB [Candidatus Saccharibacteria bacterium]|nr:tRNA (adenosine(37)-N6)-threonylcarbamoyltransferase complex dimerization subunit type 1 TsaB [Candidatus Saccharibacteria bacterium]